MLEGRSGIREELQIGRLGEVEEVFEICDKGRFVKVLLRGEEVEIVGRG